MLQLTIGVAGYLSELTGQNWIADLTLDEHWRAFINGPDGKKLFISNTWAGKGRIYISGQFPANSHRGYAEKPIQITVSDTTPASGIAKAIYRRLLPTYTPEFDRVLTSLREQGDYDRKKLATYIAAIRILGAKPPQYESKEHSAYFGRDLGTVQTLSPTKVELKNLQVTPEELRKLVNAVPELFKREEE
jgi:hypothetical protein